MSVPWWNFEISIVAHYFGKDVWVDVTVKLHFKFVESDTTFC